MPDLFYNGSGETSERCVSLAKYITDNNATVRDAAAHYGISKSTVHKDVTDRLRRKDPVLYASVREVLETNKAERHLRGGNATRLRYASLRNIEKSTKRDE